MFKGDWKAISGWKGFLSFFKSFSPSYNKSYAAKNREEKLLLYYQMQRLIRNSCTTFGQKETKKAEFAYYFREAKNLRDSKDINYFLDVMEHVKMRLEKGQYPPFPRFMPTIFARSLLKDTLCYRRFIWNINKDDLILEPGQDPIRQPFIEPRQYSSDIIKDDDYYKHIKTGIEFSDEENVFEKSDKNLVSQSQKTLNP